VIGAVHRRISLFPRMVRTFRVPGEAPANCAGARPAASAKTWPYKMELLQQGDVDDPCAATIEPAATSGENPPQRDAVNCYNIPKPPPRLIRCEGLRHDDGRGIAAAANHRAGKVLQHSPARRRAARARRRRLSRAVTPVDEAKYASTASSARRLGGLPEQRQRWSGAARETRRVLVFDSAPCLEAGRGKRGARVEPRDFVRRREHGRSGAHEAETFVPDLDVDLGGGAKSSSRCDRRNDKLDQTIIRYQSSSACQKCCRCSPSPACAGPALPQAPTANRWNSKNRSDRTARRAPPGRRPEKARMKTKICTRLESSPDFRLSHAADVVPRETMPAARVLGASALGEQLVQS